MGLHQDRAGIGPDAEIRRVTERDEPGGAEQQVQADGEQREDRDVGREEGVEARAEPRHAGRREEEEDRPGHATKQVHRPHPFIGRPSRPEGRTTSTSAISTNTANSEKPGQIENTERQHLPEHQRAEERAPERAEPADHHHDERLDDDVDVHAGHDAAHRRDQRAAEAGEERAGHERQRVELSDVGAERGEHLAVVAAARIMRPVPVRLSSSQHAIAIAGPSRMMNRL